MSAISNKSGVSVDRLAKWNGIKNKNRINIGQVLTLKAPAVKLESSMNKTYIIKTGDTLRGIAAKNGTTVKVLQSLNGIKKANTINVGQVITISGIDTSFCCWIVYC